MGTLREELIKTIGLLGKARRAMRECRSTITALRAENERLRKALEFYATQDVGTVTFHGSDDNGKRARAALSQTGGVGQMTTIPAEKGPTE